MHNDQFPSDLNLGLNIHHFMCQDSKSPISNIIHAKTTHHTAALFVGNYRKRPNQRNPTN